MKIKIDLIGDGYTETQVLTMRDEITTYAQTNNLKGDVIIIQQL